MGDSLSVEQPKAGAVQPKAVIPAVRSISGTSLIDAPQESRSANNRIKAVPSQVKPGIITSSFGAYALQAAEEGAKRLEFLPLGTKVQVNEQYLRRGWYQVVTPEGQVGYVTRSERVLSLNLPGLGARMVRAGYSDTLRSLVVKYYAPHIKGRNDTARFCHVIEQVNRKRGLDVFEGGKIKARAAVWLPGADCIFGWHFSENPDAIFYDDLMTSIAAGPKYFKLLLTEEWKELQSTWDVFVAGLVKEVGAEKALTALAQNAKKKIVKRLAGSFLKALGVLGLAYIGYAVTKAILDFVEVVDEMQGDPQGREKGGKAFAQILWVIASAVMGEVTENALSGAVGHAYKAVKGLKLSGSTSKTTALAVLRDGDPVVHPPLNTPTIDDTQVAQVPPPALKRLAAPKANPDQPFVLGQTLLGDGRLAHGLGQETPQTTPNFKALPPGPDPLLQPAAESPAADGVAVARTLPPAVRSRPVGVPALSSTTKPPDITMQWDGTPPKGHDGDWPANFLPDTEKFRGVGPYNPKQRMPAVPYGQGHRFVDGRHGNYAPKPQPKHEPLLWKPLLAQGQTLKTQQQLTGQGRASTSFELTLKQGDFKIQSTLELTHVGDYTLRKLSVTIADQRNVAAADRAEIISQLLTFAEQEGVSWLEVTHLEPISQANPTGRSIEEFLLKNNVWTLASSPASQTPTPLRPTPSNTDGPFILGQTRLGKGRLSGAASSGAANDTPTPGAQDPQAQQMADFWKFYNQVLAQKKEHPTQPDINSRTDPPHIVNSADNKPDPDPGDIREVFRFLDQRLADGELDTFPDGLGNRMSIMIWNKGKELNILSAGLRIAESGDIDMPHSGAMVSKIFGWALAKEYEIINIIDRPNGSIWSEHDSKKYTYRFSDGWYHLSDTKVEKNSSPHVENPATITDPREYSIIAKELDKSFSEPRAVNLKVDIKNNNALEAVFKAAAKGKVIILEEINGYALNRAALGPLSIDMDSRGFQYVAQWAQQRGLEDIVFIEKSLSSKGPFKGVEEALKFLVDIKHIFKYDAKEGRFLPVSAQ